MFRESWKVFMACALGAGIGSLVALELNQWLWWIGLIVGGLTGYLAYEFKKVALAILAAWKAAIYPFTSSQLLKWKVALGLSLSTLSIPLVFLLLWSFSKPGVNVTDTILWMMSGVLFGVIIGFGFIPDIMMSFVDGRTNEDKITQLRKLNYAVFPPVVIFWHLPRGLAWLALTASKFLARFCWQVFIRIHSEMRLLCMADAALGAAVGYWAGSTIIGALAGGVFGLVNYAVVTKRILEPRGLLPAR